MLLRDRLALADRDGHLPASVELAAHVLRHRSDELLRREDHLVLRGPLLDLMRVLLEGFHLVLV